MQELISVIIPVRNEENNVEELYRRLNNVFNNLDEEFEIIFVDDGSSDRTFETIRLLKDKDKHVRAVRLSRTFSQEVAITAGIDYAKGDAVITMDGDLQHPPELIPELIKKWKTGCEIVYTVRMKTEKNAFSDRIGSIFFYWLINRISGLRLERGAADFRLLSKKSSKVFRQLREMHRFNRGLINWLGFKQASVPYIAPERKVGKSKATFLRRLHLALDGIMSFSSFPLRIIGLLGIILSAAGFLYLILFISTLASGANGLTIHEILPAMLLLLVCFILAAISIIAEYILRMYQMDKKRPLYVVDETIGF